MNNKIGIIGFGRMGKIIVSRLSKSGFRVFVYDKSKSEIIQSESFRVKSVLSLTDLINQIENPRIIYLMLPAGNQVDLVINELLKSGIEKNDIIIDGGNSNYYDSINRSKLLEQYNVEYLDVGTSGGIEGGENGFCLTVGGKKEIYKIFKPFFEAIAIPNGFVHVGPIGSGHFVKMVHNAIEYGMLQALGEGYELLKKGPYKNLNLANITEVWNNGSIIRSYLIKLTHKSLMEYPDLEKIEGFLDDNGTCRWAVEEALKHNIPFNSISNALFMRFYSRQQESFAAKLISVLRNKFGGHKIKLKK